VLGLSPGRARPLWLDGGGGILRGGDARVKHAEPGARRGGQQGGRRGQPQRAGPGAERCAETARDDEHLSRPEQGPGPALLVGAPHHRLKTVLQQRLGGQLAAAADQGETRSRSGFVVGRTRQAEPGGCGRGRRHEQERQLTVRVVPGRDRGVAQQDAGVGGQGWAQDGGGDRAGQAHGGQQPGDVRSRRRHGGRRVPGQDPGADAHRGRRLEDAHHVQEAGRPAQVGDQRGERQRGRRRGARLGSAGQVRPPGQLGAQRQHGRCSRQPAEEQVAGDLPCFPHRLLEDGKPVIRAELLLGRSLPAAAAAAAATAAALAVAGQAHRPFCAGRRFAARPCVLEPAGGDL
jgi:hypothetical protein